MPNSIHENVCCLKEYTELQTIVEHCDHFVGKDIRKITSTKTYNKYPCGLLFHVMKANTNLEKVETSLV